MRGRRRRDDRGAAAVEFGLVAIVFFTLVFGIIQFGMWLWTWEQAAHAAREASRYGAVHPTCETEIKAKGQQALEGAPVDPEATITVVWAGSQVGDPISVRVEAKPINIGFLDIPIPSVDKTAISRVENIPATSAGCPA